MEAPAAAACSSELPPPPAPEGSPAARRSLRSRPPTYGTPICVWRLFFASVPLFCLSALLCSVHRAPRVSRGKNPSSRAFRVAPRSASPLAALAAAVATYHYDAARRRFHRLARCGSTLPSLALLHFVKYRTPLEEYRELRLALSAAAAAAGSLPPAPHPRGARL